MPEDIKCTQNDRILDSYVRMLQQQQFHFKQKTIIIYYYAYCVKNLNKFIMVL